MASGIGRSSVRWEHGIGFSSHSELKGVRMWRKKNVQIYPRSEGEDI